VTAGGGAPGTLIRLPRVEDARGNLSFAEGGRHVPFAIRRTYWVYDVPGGEARGGHAHVTLDEVLIALSGSFDVRLDDGRGEQVVTLNRSYVGLLVPRMTWRRLENFSTNAVCLALASAAFDEADYVRDYDAFVGLVHGGGAP
jgi:oxalate decarboxylase/phosphoglucose isomerase-like protein (cupin superfamily)